MNRKADAIIPAYITLLRQHIADIQTDMGKLATASHKVITRDMSTGNRNTEAREIISHICADASAINSIARFLKATYLTTCFLAPAETVQEELDKAEGKQ